VIAVDTSALIAVLLREPAGDNCRLVLEAAPQVQISAGTMAEALIVATQRGVGDKMAELIDKVGIEVVAVTAHGAGLVADAYAQWGKGIHPARLNLGDCFAYSLAKARGCPLLFVGDDFSRTDIAAAV
jgi:ribonuclease VapC